MSTVVPFEGYTPSARTDGLPWLGARVWESATVDGTYAQIDAFAFATDPRVEPSGLDVDPENPRERSFTTAIALLPVGWYKVVFYDASNNLEPTDPVYHGGPILPGVQQVAHFLRARTMGAGGQLNVFTAFTDPTIDQVEDYIQSAAADVISTVGRDIPVQASDLARKVIEVSAAMLIELGSEDINEVRYDRLKTLYDERLARLFEAVVEYGGDVIDPIEEDGESAGALGTPLPLGIVTGRGSNKEWD